MKEQNIHFEKILSILPPIENIKVRSEVDFYGISTLIAKGLKLPFTPRSTKGWKHGWLFPKLKYTEQLTGITKGVSKFLVPLSEHETFLTKKGIESKAVGMPFLYVEDTELEKIERQKNSLLVMPPHSLSSTNHNWDEETYAEEISKIKDDFDLIVVCLYHTCIEKRLWMDAFRKYDIPWIVGASSLDKNSLIRMNRLFKSFEYMTTNSIGSHIVYAAYCGCKVSIYGSYAEYSEKDYKDDAFYKRYPYLLKYNLEYNSEETVKTRFPYLFSYPLQAKKRVKWAGKQLGKENKVTLLELAILLGWLPHNQVMLYSRKIYFKIKNQIKNIFNSEL